MYSCFIFDIDGTLIDTEKPILLGLQQALKTVANRDYEISELTFAFGIPGRETLKQLGVPEPQAVHKQWLEHIDEYRDQMHVYDGMKETLDQLKKGNATLGIVTSKSRNQYEKNFLPFGLGDYFDIAIVADDTEKHKPNPEPMLEFLKRSGARPEEAVYIGDTPYDMHCALDANVSFALASWGAGNHDFSKATHVLKRPQDLLQLKK